MATLQEFHAAATRKPNEFLYLLINPLVSIDSAEPVHPEQLKKTTKITVVPRADLAHVPEQCPQLVILAQPGQDAPEYLINSSLEWAQAELGYERRYLCGWLTSDEGPLEVTQTIADHCIIREADANSQRKLMPLFDPLRIELMQGCNISDWQDGWLGCISNWLYLSEDGALTSLPRKSIQPWNNALPECISRAQFHARAVGALLLTWGRTQRSLPPKAATLALEQIRTAHMIGLFGLEDQLVFGLNRLTIHPKIERHPAVLSAIQQAAMGKASLATSLEQIDDNIWDEIADMPR